MDKQKSTLSHLFYTLNRSNVITSMSLTAVSRGCVCVKANLHNRKLLIMRKRKMTA